MMRSLFKASRESLGSRQLSKRLKKEGFKIGRYRTPKLMKKLGLVVKQRRQYKVTTVRKHSDTVVDNVLAQQFNPTKENVAWCGDMTYLPTREGWLYLATVMDLYSRKMMGWSMGKRLSKGLVIE